RGRRRRWWRCRTGIYTPAGRVGKIAGGPAVGVCRKRRGVKGHASSVLRRRFPGESPTVLPLGRGDDSAERVLHVLAPAETTHAIDEFRPSVTRDHKVACLLSLIVQRGQLEAEEHAVRLIDGDCDLNILARRIIGRSRYRHRTAAAVDRPR